LQYNGRLAMVIVSGGVVTVPLTVKLLLAVLLTLATVALTAPAAALVESRT
jgi:hypothetical protein